VAFGKAAVGCGFWKSCFLDLWKSCCGLWLLEKLLWMKANPFGWLLAFEGQKPQPKAQPKGPLVLITIDA